MFADLRRRANPALARLAGDIGDVALLSIVFTASATIGAGLFYLLIGIWIDR